MFCCTPMCAPTGCRIRPTTRRVKKRHVAALEGAPPSQTQKSPKGEGERERTTTALKQKPRPSKSNYYMCAFLLSYMGSPKNSYATTYTTRRVKLEPCGKCNSITFPRSNVLIKCGASSLIFRFFWCGV